MIRVEDISGWIQADIVGWDTFGWMVSGIHKFMKSDGHPPFKFTQGD